jgi:hypothetical protein
MTPNRWVAGASGLVFVAGFVVATATPGPLLTIDDLANFGLAHAIAGQGSVPMPAQAPYGPLYPALLAPGWLLGLDESGMLVWARGVNALAGALLVPVLYALVRRVSDVDWRFALGAAVAAAMLPAGMLTASIAWSERLLWLLVATAALALTVAVDRRDGRTAVLAALAGVALFAGHPRLAPAAGIVILVAVGVLLRSSVRGARGLLIASGVALLAVERFRAAIADAAFGSSGTYDAGDLASRRGIEELFPAAPQHALGAVTYLVLAGTLVAVWGAVVLARDRRTWPVLAMGVAVLAVAAWFLTGVPRSDRWLHGRYIEVIAPVLFAVGLANLDRLRARTAVALGFALPVAAGVVAAWNGPGNTWASPRSPVMMLGVEVSGAPYGGAVFEPGAAASVAIVAGLILWACARWRTPILAAVVAVIMSLWAVDSGDTTLDRLFATTAAGEVADRLPTDEAIGEVFVDITTVSPNLTNAVAWEVGFDRAVTEASTATTHLLIPLDAEPPPGSVSIAEFSNGTLWRLP